MKVILVFFLFCGVAWADLNCECGKRNAGRIVGGKDTKKNEYPWMTSLTENGFPICGGTIITTWHVLTAGHCVAGKDANDLILYVGAYDINDISEVSRQDLYIDRIIMHPYFDGKILYADIAVIVTSTEIAFNQNVGPACMPRGGIRDELVGQMVKAMGWGRHDPASNNHERVQNLKEIDVQVVSVNACMTYKGSKICTKAQDKSPCKGDSGGPLVWLDPEINRFTLVGVISAARQCGISTPRPSTSVNVSFYIDWINGIVSYTKSQANTCHKAVAYFRTITGHDFLRKHLHRTGIEDSPDCPLCNNREMTLEHRNTFPALEDIRSCYRKTASILRWLIDLRFQV